jgi:hypothetical protein
MDAEISDIKEIASLLLFSKPSMAFDVLSNTQIYSNKL